MLDDEACVALDPCGISVVADGNGGVEPNSKQVFPTFAPMTGVWVFTHGFQHWTRLLLLT